VKMTRREEEVLSGLMKSLANKEIAANLNLSERTVKFHVSSLLAKFRVRGRMELVRVASRQTSGAAPMPIAVPARWRHGRHAFWARGKKIIPRRGGRQALFHCQTANDA